jgi:hypothetical protein
VLLGTPAAVVASVVAVHGKSGWGLPNLALLLSIIEAASLVVIVWLLYFPPPIG